jgi:hypothetical protein
VNTIIIIIELRKRIRAMSLVAVEGQRLKRKVAVAAQRELLLLLLVVRRRQGPRKIVPILTLTIECDKSLWVLLRVRHHSSFIRNLLSGI